MQTKRKLLEWLPIVGIALIPSLGLAQAVPTPAAVAKTPGENTTTEEEMIELPVFEVNSQEDVGRYDASSTLAGSRVRTDLRDVATPLTVVTSEFLKNTQAKNSSDLLVYTVGTEVGGLGGNFSGLGNQNGINESRALVAPNQNTRVRGLDQADNTRDYFTTDIPWDSYNVDRVDLQRGPNSILFGIGSPAGIINTSTIVPTGKDGGKVTQTFGSYASSRWTLDYNKVLVKNLAAIRIAAVDDLRYFQQKPAFSHDRRFFGAAKITPQLFSKDIASPLNIRVNYEAGNGRSNMPRVLPPIDRITPWFTEMGKKLYNPYFATAAVQNLSSGQPSNRNGQSDNSYGVPWLAASFAGTYDNSMVAYYQNGESMPFSTLMKQIRASAFDKNGNVNAGLGGTYAELLTVAPFSIYAKNIDYLDRSANAASRYPAATKGFWKDKTLSDSSVFDFYNQLVDGNNKREWRDFNAMNVGIAQSFYNNRLSFEGVYDYQENTQGASGATFGGTPYISVDINASTMRKLPNMGLLENGFLDPVWTGGEANPHAGEAYLSGTTPNAYSEKTQRTNYRLTANADLRASDIFDRQSTLAKILGHHSVTALVSSDKAVTSARNWIPFAIDTSWLGVIGQGSNNLGSANRSIGTVVYTSANLNGSKVTNLNNVSSASGLHLSPMTTIINPGNGLTGEYWNGKWAPKINPDTNAPYTFGDYYRSTFPNAGSSNAMAFDSTQSDNPNNYQGWTKAPLPMLNADNGDIDQLTTSASKYLKRVKSQAITWQGYLFGGDLVGTYGWRRDEERQFGVAGARDPQTAVVSNNIALIDDGSPSSTGNSNSWGIVGHLPTRFAKHLPLGMALDAFYNRGSNFKAETRYGSDTKPLPNPQGRSEDYGVVVRLLNDRLMLKVTKFKTTVENATLPGDAASSLLGSQFYLLNELDGRGAGNVAINVSGDHGYDNNEWWFWNWRWKDENIPFDDVLKTDSDYFNSAPTKAKYAAMDAFVAGMPNQAWYDAMGYKLDVAAYKAAYAAKDGPAMVRAFNNGNWAGTQGTLATISSSSGGKVNNVSYPVGTISQKSEGYEFEIVGRIKDNWNVSINASKTSAARGELGASTVAWIEAMHERWNGPAGDLRLWWAGDADSVTKQGMGKMFNDNLYSSYLFQKAAKGQMAPEIRPWRFNAVTNYSIIDGRLKGVGVGGALRWQDRSILGYKLNDALDNLDPTRPIHSPTEMNLDMWVSYNRKISPKLSWEVQLNVRNVGEKARLVPISVNPDGSVAASRIANGTEWALTNTFSF